MIINSGEEPQAQCPYDSANAKIITFFFFFRPLKNQEATKFKNPGSKQLNLLLTNRAEKHRDFLIFLVWII